MTAIVHCIIGDRAAGARARDEHGDDAAASKEVTGEVVDMMCYVDHNAMGENHGQSCGSKCIKNGGPVGIVRMAKPISSSANTSRSTTNWPILAARTITLKGKLAERGGVAMLENAEIVKK